MPKNGQITTYDDAGFATDAINATPVLTGTAGSAVIKAGPGRLISALVTTAGTGTDNLTIYDNASAASGTILAVVAGGGTVGAVLNFSMPAVNGIYASNVASGPAVTLGWS